MDKMYKMFIILILGFIPFTYLSCTALIISTLANACAESVTDQIDNLVVPLTAYNVFNLVVFLRDFIPFL